MLSISLRKPLRVLQRLDHGLLSHYKRRRNKLCGCQKKLARRMRRPATTLLSRWTQPDTFLRPSVLSRASAHSSANSPARETTRVCPGRSAGREAFLPAHEIPNLHAYVCPDVCSCPCTHLAAEARARARFASHARVCARLSRRGLLRDQQSLCRQQLWLAATSLHFFRHWESYWSPHRPE